MMIEGKEILIIGGTGSLGKTITKELIHNHKPRGIRIYSRDEFKQWEMKKEMQDTNYWKGNDGIGVSFLVGDVRDCKRLNRAMNGVDIVINAAAMKQVPACEYNPIEAVKTNIHGAENIIDCAIDNKVKNVMHISTDKAVEPINLYGATKTVAEKLFVHANVYTGDHGTKFSCCRYGNVLGSRGSIIPLFKEQIEKGYVTITDPDMTRFWITLDQVAKFILNSICEMQGCEIFIPKMPSMLITELAKSLSKGKDIDYKIIGMRQGEKLHECLVSKYESIYTKQYNDKYIINIFGVEQDEIFEYNSLKNTWNLSKEELSHILLKENLL